MELAHPLPSDGQLVEATRRGAAPAWTELVSRHGRAVRAVASALRIARPRRAADQALERLRRSIVEQEPVEEGAPAVRAVRVRAIAELTGGTPGPWPAPDVGPQAPDGGDDDAVLAEAYMKLPEPWQTVLWHSVVEDWSAGEMTPLLGRGVNDVLALLHTARSGLHQAYLRSLAEDAGAGGATLAPDCRPVVPLLAAAGRGTLAAAEQRAVDAHLLAGRDGGPCRSCRSRIDLVATVDERLPSAIVPGVTGLTVDRYRQLVGASDRSFGTAALDATRSSRGRRLAIGAAAVVIVSAVVGALLLIRPFDDSMPLPTFVTADPSTTAGGDPSTTVGGDPTTTGVSTTASTPATTTAAPTTTELILRPPPTGPANTVELVFGAGERALGVAAPELPLSVELAPAGRVLAAGTGTFDLTVTNTGSAPLAANVEVRTPPGLLFDALVAGPATCQGPGAGAAFCNVSLGGGESATLAIRLRLESTVVGRLVLQPGPYGSPLEIGIAATPRLVHSSVERGETLLIGNTVMTCVESAPACPGARDLTGDVVNRWDVPLEFVGGALGWTNSSAATLDLADGAGVSAAYLVWSGDLDEGDLEVADEDGGRRATVLAPGADAPVSVEADRRFLGDVDATKYLAVADVTDLVAAAGGGEYRVGDIASVEVRGSYAGWGLVVVTADPSLPRRQHLVVSPFAWVAPDYSYRRDLPVPFDRDSALAVDIVAFEGDPGFRGERLEIGGQPVGGDNEFDGSVPGGRDPAYVNNFGIDIETYDLTIDAPDGTVTIDATSDDDGVRLAVLGLTVDLPS